MAGILINIDAFNFFFAGKLDAKDVCKEIDFYVARGGVEAILFNMNFQRCLWRSHSREAIWDGVEETPDGRFLFLGKTLRDIEPEPPMLTIVRNAKRFSERCPEVFELRYRHCHERGVEMWHSMRMNDVHFTPDADLPEHSGLWRTRPDLWRCHYRLPYSPLWEDKGLDYLQPEVREHQMALVREYLEHECDGIELDWLRTLPLFRPGMEEPAIPLLTSFVREVRREANRAEKAFGHRVRIAVRVPRGPLECLRMGLDVMTWACEGLVDIVIPSPPHCVNSALHMPLDIWRQLLPVETVLAPCIDFATDSRPGGPSVRIDSRADTGLAATFYHRGADTIYLYNHFRWSNRPIDSKAMQESFGYLGKRESVYRRARRHVVSYFDTEGKCEGGRGFIDLPEVAPAKGVVAFPIDAGGATAGRDARVIIGADGPFHAEIRLNGVVCPGLPEHPSLETAAITYQGELQLASFQIPRNVLHDGRNTIDIINLGERSFRPLWAEIFIEEA